MILWTEIHKTRFSEIILSLNTKLKITFHLLREDFWEGQQLKDELNRLFPYLASNKTFYRLSASYEFFGKELRMGDAIDLDQNLEKFHNRLRFWWKIWDQLWSRFLISVKKSIKMCLILIDIFKILSI